MASQCPSKIPYNVVQAQDLYEAVYGIRQLHAGNKDNGVRSHLSPMLNDKRLEVK